MGHTREERWLAKSLLGAGHRVTGPRQRLLAAVAGLGDQFTAEELAAAAPGVGRATVFACCWISVWFARSCSTTARCTTG